MSGPQGWGQQGIGQQGGQMPQSAFPGATPAGTPDAEDEPGQQNFFPPASGV